MSTLLTLVPVAGCAAMMLLCGRVMRRGDCAKPGTTDTAEVEQLRAEVAKLRARLEPDAHTDSDQPTGPVSSRGWGSAAPPPPHQHNAAPRPQSGVRASSRRT